MSQTLAAFTAIVRLPVIEPAKHRESLFTMTHYRLMPIYPERSPQPQITNSFQNTGFTTAVLAVQEIKGRRKSHGCRRQVAEVFSLEFNQRHGKRTQSGMEGAGKLDPYNEKGSVTHSENAALVYKSQCLKATTASMKHIQPLIHEHIHFRREDMHITIKVQKLFQ